MRKNERGKKKMFASLLENEVKSKNKNEHGRMKFNRDRDVFLTSKQYTDRRVSEAWIPNTNFFLGLCPNSAGDNMDGKLEISLDKLPIKRLDVIEENGLERFPPYGPSSLTTLRFRSSRNFDFGVISLIQWCRLRGEAGVADSENRFRMGGGEGRQEQAEEEIQRELSGAVGVPEHGGESTVGSSGALCHYRSHQYCKSLSLSLTLQSLVISLSSV